MRCLVSSGLEAYVEWVDHERVGHRLSCRVVEEYGAASCDHQSFHVVRQHGVSALWVVLVHQP